MNQQADQATSDVTTLRQPSRWAIAVERGSSRTPRFCVMIVGGVPSGETPLSDTTMAAFTSNPSGSAWTQYPTDFRGDQIYEVFGAEEDPLADLPDEDFEANPRLFVGQAVGKAMTHPNTGQVLTRKLFPHLLTKSPAQRRLVHRAILAFAKPDEILETALAQYRAFGYEGRLLVAASLLQDMGEKAWPTLQAIAKSQIPEVHAFVSLITSLDEIPVAERTEAMLNLSRNPNPEVRSQVLEAWEDFKNWPGATRILTQLAAVNTYRDWAQETAQDKFESLKE